MIVTSPDGSQRMERFEETSDLIKRTLDLQRELLETGWRQPKPLETDFRRLLCRDRRFEQRVILEAEDLRRDDARKLAPARVVLLHALVVAHPLDRDAVLGARQLIGQTVELFVRFQIRIVLDDDEQPPSAALCWLAAAIVSAGVCAPASFARDSAIC